MRGVVRASIMMVSMLLGAFLATEARAQSRGGPVFGRLSANKYLQGEIRLSRRQLTRMREIQIRLMGYTALFRPDVARDVGLSDTQKRSLWTGYRKASAKLAATYKLPDGSRVSSILPNSKDIAKQLRDKENTMKALVYKTLTTLQRKRFDKIAGTPLKADTLKAIRFGKGDRTFGRLLQSQSLRSELAISKRQLTRMREIRYQLLGFTALIRDDVAEQLVLSDNQRKRIDEIFQKSQSTAKSFPLGMIMRTGRHAINEQLAELMVRMKIAESAILKVLSATQRRRFDKMQGRAIDWDAFDGRKRRPDV